MTVWRSFGASVIGPGHVVAGKPNQDSWLAFHHVFCDGIVVADGLGSKPLSDFGSKAACLAVAKTVDAYGKRESIERTELLDEIMNKWRSLIAPLTPRDCATTCLFALGTGDGEIHMGMLGDGFIAAIKDDGEVVSLSDEKTEGFSNITDALSTNVTNEDWRWLSIPEEDCKTIILCTDGVADDLEDADGFVKGFAETHCGLSSVTAARRTCRMLESWPTPKHSDDKTIACLFQEEITDE